ncbi:hypothetical protein [Streptomyces sp. LBL]|uniref:hypothetical protein n=1 Tax=Streptomyces sp. LBL TaxID=2940562 RepID=UPI002474B350|nr:hypothetical protein [Streptomyces sp. LBL]
MGTAERHEVPSDDEAGDVVAQLTGRRSPEAPDRDIPADGHVTPGERGVPVAARGGLTVRESAAPAATDVADEERRGASGATEVADDGRFAAEERPYYRPLWVEEPARRRRLPDPVRTSAVRAVMIIAVTLTQAMVAFLCTMAGSWLAFPMVLSSVAGTVVATWGALDVWVTRQVWSQRNGVVSIPSSTARALRRERRKARRHARATERTQERIRRREGAGQVAHS